MKIANRLTVAVLACSGFLFGPHFRLAFAEAVDVTAWQAPDGFSVRYMSGQTVYVEKLRGGRWIGCGWSAAGRTDLETMWADDAFELRIKDQPTPPKTPGLLLSTGWTWAGCTGASGAKPGSLLATVRLSNKSFAVDLRIHTVLDGTPVLTRWLDITNTSKRPLALTACIPWCGRLWSGDAPINLGHSLRWEVPWEGWFGWTALKSGKNAFESHHGLAWDDPYFVLRNQSNGEYFFGQLAWPVNYTMEFNRERGLSFKTGPLAANALRVISAGETIRTPAVHLAYTKGDFDATVQAMHDHVRRSVIPPRRADRAHLIQYLFPEDQLLTVYRGDECSETNLKKVMDVCAAVGVELFILDGPTWAEGYGNWVPKKKWFPNGLGPLRQYAHQKGLLFGVYAEVEGGRGDWSQTKAFQHHRDWFASFDGSLNASYNKCFLNLAIPEAANYMASELTGLIDRHKVDIYRHDQNLGGGGDGSATVREGFVESDFWRHHEAFYAICDRVRAKYPDLILQQASGGGTRLELATLAKWDENYTSDRVTYPYVYRMASGLSVYLPPETLVTPIGMAGNGKNQPDFVTQLRAIYALGQTPMIFNAMLPKSVEELTPGIRQQCLRYANLYKTFMRPILPTCRVYHHAPVNATGGVESGDWFAMEFGSPDKRKGWAIVVRLSANATGTYLLKPKGLNSEQEYTVTRDNTGQTETKSGAKLMTEGLRIHLPTDRSSELVLFDLRTSPHR
jgi:alpha-galactosidase